MKNWLPIAQSFAQKTLKALLFFVLFATTILAVPTKTFAQPAQGMPQAWSGVCIYEHTRSGTNVATIKGLQCLFANVLMITVTFIGLAAFMVFVVSAFKLMLAGNSKGLETAKNSITYAVLGIVVALSAFVFFNLLSSFTGINLTRFMIGID